MGSRLSSRSRRCAIGGSLRNAAAPPAGMQKRHRHKSQRRLHLVIGTAGFDAPACEAGGAGRRPASGAKAPQAPKLNPRPPDAEPARQRRRSGRGGVGKCGGVNPMRTIHRGSYDTM